MMDSSTALTFNLNLQPSAEHDPNHQEGGNLMEVISRIDRESKRMSEMFEKCSAMHSQLMDLIIHGDNNNTNLQRKRKARHLDDNNEDYDDDNNNNLNNLSELSSCVSDGNCCNRVRMISCKPKITTSLIRIDSQDTSLVVKDGYQWRKYGQKVTRDNPSPRAYFKCSFAPICPVKKKVQKSVEDPTVLVATYEGEHNHKKHSSVGTLITPSTIISSSLINLSPSSCISSPSPSLDHLTHQNHSGDNHKQRGSDNEEDNDDQPRSALQHWLVEQMASSITKDPSFASTLAAAISDKVIEHTFC